MSRYRPETAKSSALSAIENMFSMAEDLASEAREVCDSIPESLQSGGRGEAFGCTADVLEGLRAPDAPENCPDPECTVTEMVRGGKKRGQESRAIRASNAAAHGRAGADAIRGVDRSQPGRGRLRRRPRPRARKLLRRGGVGL